MLNFSTLDTELNLTEPIMFLKYTYVFFKNKNMDFVFTELKPIKFISVNLKKGNSHDIL